MNDLLVVLEESMVYVATDRGLYPVKDIWGMDDHCWLAVTAQQQADYSVDAWRMAQKDWPMLEVFTVWNLGAKPTGHGASDEIVGYSLLDENEKPKPAWHALHRAFTSTKPRPSIGDLWKRFVSLFSDQPSYVLILAQDQEIHLGDNE